jgi:serine-type D-Ala-D-Ala carboxypeptidase
VVQKNDWSNFKSMKLKKPEELINEALGLGMFTAAALIVSCRDQIVHNGYYGVFSKDLRQPLTQDALFDLASLTKIIATTPSWFFLRAKRPDILDAPIARWFSKIPEHKGQITPRFLLAHSSGLPAWKPYYLMAPATEAKEFIKDRIFREPLVYAPGKGCIYSDLGFMILSFIVEAETGYPLDLFVKEFIYEALGLHQDLMFKPFDFPDRIVLTRRGDSPGLVNDLNARALGGVSGHAGLFGTARGVTEMAQQVLLGLQSKEAFFDNSTVSEFCSLAGFHPASSRGLGFDTNLETAASCGGKFSPRSVGHTGFTGTSLWIDPEKELVVTFLTNRVYMGESDFRIKDFRPKLHDAVIEEIQSQRRKETS